MSWFHRWVWIPIDNLGAVLILAWQWTLQFVRRHGLPMALVLVALTAIISATLFRQPFLWTSIASLGAAVVALTLLVFPLYAFQAVRYFRSHHIRVKARWLPPAHEYEALGWVSDHHVTGYRNHVELSLTIPDGQPLPTDELWCVVSSTQWLGETIESYGTDMDQRSGPHHIDPQTRSIRLQYPKQFEPSVNCLLPTVWLFEVGWHTKDNVYVSRHKVMG